MRVFEIIILIKCGLFYIADCEERSHIECTRLPSRIYQYMNSQVLRPPIWRGPDIFMNVSVQEQRALNNLHFSCGKVINQ